MFVDKIKITLKSGDGGNGAIHLRRIANNPKAGPDGGNGGNGGSIYFLTDLNVIDLSHLSMKKIYVAENGENGKKNKCNGKSGCSLILKIPVGSTVKILNNNKIIDLDKDKVLYKILDGGRGGFGNAHFANSVYKTPMFAEIGEKGKMLDLEIEFKLIADVAIVGLPNAGKSTLISSISNAKPKIGNYPFTTLSPVLGVVLHKKNKVVFADIPGLIKDAHKGKGLGVDFLRHVERCSIILHLVSAESDNIYNDFCVVENELKKYFGNNFYNKKYLIAISKMDILNYQESTSIIDFKNKIKGKIKNDRIFYISSVTHFNISKLLDFIIGEVKKVHKEKEKYIVDKNIFNTKDSNDIFSDDKILNKIIVDKDTPIYSFTKIDDKNVRNYTIKKVTNKWVVDGYRINQIANMTDENNKEAMQRLFYILKKIGVDKYLQNNNASFKDIVFVGDKKISVSDIVDFDV